MPDEHEPLVERVRFGDVDALAAYIEAKRGALLAFIDRELGQALRSKIEPEDVLQEVSATACASLPSTNAAECEPMAWLCQIARHKIVDNHRRFVGAQKRASGREVPLGSPGGDTQHAGLIDLLSASMTTASKAFSRNEKEIRLLAALGKLPADQQQVLQLRYGEGLASNEIATRLGKTDGAVRVMLTRALNMLRDRFGPEDA